MKHNNKKTVYSLLIPKAIPLIKLRSALGAGWFWSVFCGGGGKGFRYWFSLVVFVLLECQRY